MKLTTIKQLWKLNRERLNSPLLGESADLETFPFMAPYVQNFGHFDRNFAKEFGCFAPLWNRQEELNDDDVLDEFKRDILSLLYVKREGYQRMFALNGIEYNPLENYDKNEEIMSTNGGSDTLTITKGEKTTLDERGQRTDSTSYGAQNGESVGSTKGFNSDTFVETDKSVTNTSAYSDTTQMGMQTNTLTELENEDTHNTEYGKTTNIVNHTHGNIGVTTTQQMMQSEIDLWSAFAFYKIIFTDIVKELCVLEDYGISPFDPCFSDEESGRYSGAVHLDAKVSVEQTSEGAVIKVQSNGEATEASVKNGLTPIFQVDEDSNLYVDYTSESEV